MVAKNYIFGRKYGANFLTNLVAYYPLNSNANDSINGYNGTQVGTPTFTSGKVSNAINFGTDNVIRYVNIPDKNDFSFTSGTNDVPFSISMWVNFSFLNTEANILINKRNNTIGGDEWQVASASNKIYLNCFDATTRGYIAIGFPFSTLNTWVHLVATYNANASYTGLKLYLNGVNQTVVNASNGTYTKMPNGTTAVRIGIGGWDTRVALKHKGLIDELAIWKNRELTAIEVLELYNKGNAGTPII